MPRYHLRDACDEKVAVWYSEVATFPPTINPEVVRDYAYSPEDGYPKVTYIQIITFRSVLLQEIARRWTVPILARIK